MSIHFLGFNSFIHYKDLSSVRSRGLLIRVTKPSAIMDLFRGFEPVALSAPVAPMVRSYSKLTTRHNRIQGCVKSMIAWAVKKTKDG